jgi:hypothetical protein
MPTFQLSLMLLTSGVIANIFKLSLISIIQSSRTSKLFSRTYIQQAAKGDYTN